MVLYKVTLRRKPGARVNFVGSGSVTMKLPTDQDIFVVENTACVITTLVKLGNLEIVEADLKFLEKG